MERGTPAVISDIEIFREIGGSAARYFNTENPASLVNEVRLLEADWSAVSKESRLQARKFVWESSADALLEVMQRL